MPYIVHCSDVFAFTYTWASLCVCVCSYFPCVKKHMHHIVEDCGCATGSLHFPLNSLTHSRTLQCHPHPQCCVRTPEDGNGIYTKLPICIAMHAVVVVYASERTFIGAEYMYVARCVYSCVRRTRCYVQYLFILYAPRRRSCVVHFIIFFLLLLLLPLVLPFSLICVPLYLIFVSYIQSTHCAGNIATATAADAAAAAAVAAAASTVTLFHMVFYNKFKRQTNCTLSCLSSV